MDCACAKDPLGKPGVCFEAEGNCCNTVEAGFSLACWVRVVLQLRLLSNKDGGKSSN